MSPQTWLWTKELSFQSSMDTAHKLIEEVMGHLDETVWGSKDVFAVNLALEEALVNAVQHGNRLDPDKKVHFICRLNNDKVYVRIEDEGEGFDPNAVPDPTDDDHIMTVSGRGCLLIKGFVSRACWNDTGNVIEFEKDRTTN